MAWGKHGAFSSTGTSVGQTTRTNHTPNYRIIGVVLSGTLAFADHVSLAAEALKIFTQRNAWAYYGLDERKDERQLQLSVRLRFGN